MESFLKDSNCMCFSAVGCRSNNDCADKQACKAKECINPCEEKACSRTEVCDVVGHAARCLPSKTYFFELFLNFCVDCQQEHSRLKNQ